MIIGVDDQQLFLPSLLLFLHKAYTGLPILPHLSLFSILFFFAYSSSWLIDFISHTKTSGSSPGHRHLESWNRDVGMKRKWRWLGFICQSTTWWTEFLAMKSECHFRNNKFDSFPVYSGFCWWKLEYRVALAKQYTECKIVQWPCKPFLLGSYSCLPQPLRCWLKWVRLETQVTYSGHNTRKHQVPVMFWLLLKAVLPWWHPCGTLLAFLNLMNAPVNLKVSLGDEVCFSVPQGWCEPLVSKPHLEHMLAKYDRPLLPGVSQQCKCTLFHKRNFTAFRCEW